MSSGKFEATNSAEPARTRWPGWAKGLVSLAILVHAGAVLSGAFGARPSSKLEDDLALFFRPYHQFFDLGVSYRYYSTAFPPTPVVTATLSFQDGRPEKVVRIPDRSLWPRLRLQRQLALAHHLMEDYEAAEHETGDGRQSRWANAFATHLGQINPGCSSVSLDIQMHLVPTIERIEHLQQRKSAGPIDLDADEFFGETKHIGVFPCAAS